MEYEGQTPRKTVDKCVYTLSTLSTLSGNLKRPTKGGVHVIWETIRWILLLLRWPGGPHPIPQPTKTFGIRSEGDYRRSRNHGSWTRWRISSPSSVLALRIKVKAGTVISSTNSTTIFQKNSSLCWKPLNPSSSGIISSSTGPSCGIAWVSIASLF